MLYPVELGLRGDLCKPLLCLNLRRPRHGAGFAGLIIMPENARGGKPDPNHERAAIQQ
jgi:hypothetical protein